VEPLIIRIRLYRSLYLLNILHDKSYLKIHFPVLVSFLGFFCICGICGVIKLRNEVHFMEFVLLVQCSITCTFLSYLFLHYAGKLYHYSYDVSQRKFNESCAKQGTWLRKFSKSIIPIGIRIGSVKAIKFKALFTFFLTITNVCVTILVSFSANT